MLYRLIFDFALWCQPPHAIPILLVCEEAHRYVPNEDTDGTRSTKKLLSRISKESRNYCVSLCLTTQRALPESAQGFVSSLPSLHSWEVAVIGEGVTVPMRFRFDDLAEAHRPRSGNASFSTA